jgi:tetratricopeptide (TPR) repeat protein
MNTATSICRAAFNRLQPSISKEKNMKLKALLSFIGIALLSVSMQMMAQPAPAKIHGHVTDPTGIPKANGSVSLSLDDGRTAKYTFPVSATGDFTGDGIAPGTYALIYRQPDTPEGKFVDLIANIKIVAGDDIRQDVDMTRKEYLDKMTPEQRKQAEEFAKKNAEVLKNNSVIKGLNVDLAEARTDNHDKKFAEAETLMLKDTAVKVDGELLWYELGLAQLGLKKWDEAAVSLKKTIDLATASKKPDPSLIAGAQAALGEVYARNSKPDDATAQYDAAAKTNPSKAAFYYRNEAVVFQNVNNADAQAAAADKAIAADPKDPLPYYLKGQALAGKITVDPKGNYVMPPGCAEAYNKYLELAPTGQFANDVKALLAATQTKVETKLKVTKK